MRNNNVQNTKKLKCERKLPKREEYDILSVNIKQFFIIAEKGKGKNQTSDGEKGNQTMVDI